MSIHLWFLFSVLAASALFAYVEIQVEGRHGWAERLPTWKLDTAFTRRLWGGRPLTGYHVGINLFMLTVVHLPYGLGLTDPNWATEARIAAFFILFWVVEDFFWFVMNPDYGLMRFRPEYIWWHRQAWWWVAPREYWLFTPLACLLYWASIGGS